MPEEVFPQWVRWGQELRRQRERTGKTQAQLASRARISRQALSKYEKATRKPGVGTARRLDEVLATGQVLHQLWRDIAGTGDVPQEWVDFLALEQLAVAIREYHPVLIPGLLQSESYIRWVFDRAFDSDDASDKAVASRLGRLGNLRPRATVRAVVDEVVLGRISGSHEVMREQYDHILRLIESKTVILMILPGYAPQRPIATGGFRILTLEEGRQIVHASYAGGYAVKEHPAEVDRLSSLFGDFQAESLSPTESTTLLKKMRDDL